MLLFSYFSEGAHAPTVPVLSLSAVCPPHLVSGAPAAGPGDPQPVERQTYGRGRAAPGGSAEPRLRSGQEPLRGEWCGGTARSPFLQLLRPPSAYTRGERKGEGRQGKAQVQPALTCSPFPSAAQRGEYFNSKGWRCLRGEVLAGCSQAVGGRAAGGGAPTGHGGCAPARALARTRGDGNGSAAAAPLLLLHGTARHCTGSRWAHDGRSGCRCQAQLRLGADRGCGRRRKRREGRSGEGGRKQRRWGCCSGQGISRLGGWSRLPAPSEGARRRHRDSLYLPKTQRWLLKRDPGSEQPARPHYPPTPRLFSSSSLTGYTDGVLWIKIRSRARGWGGNQSLSLFAFETGS